mmetsp:Transcript_115537/g.248301  ORF Transcript_115537/g.248301 Transcript_115537/m.248301 type:complete len:152 (+) Transcript_115537:130-585(+)
MSSQSTATSAESVTPPKLRWADLQDADSDGEEASEREQKGLELDQELRNVTADLVLGLESYIFPYAVELRSIIVHVLRHRDELVAGRGVSLAGALSEPSKMERVALNRTLRYVARLVPGSAWTVDSHACAQIHLADKQRFEDFCRQRHIVT